MGRILSTTSDSKGLVRSVMIQIKTSILERPATKLCLLLEAVSENASVCLSLTEVYVVLYSFDVLEGFHLFLTISKDAYEVHCKSHAYKFANKYTF